MSKEKLLIIGLGNLLMGDDGAGIHIINELKRRNLPDHVEVMDGGTAGIDLVDILPTYREVIVIDAIKDKGDNFSDMRLVSPDDLIFRGDDGNYSIHDMELTSALNLIKALNMDMPAITIIGIPAVDVTPGNGLSEECSRFVPEAVDLIMDMSNSPIPPDNPPLIKGDGGFLGARGDQEGRLGRDDCL